MVDDGSPFSAIGDVELRFHQKPLADREMVLDPKPSELYGCDFWQFGAGGHASRRGRVVVSIVLLVTTDPENQITLRHIVIEGSSQWILGRNIIRACIIQHISAHALVLPTQQSDKISMCDFEHHSHVSVSCFILSPAITHPRPATLSCDDGNHDSIRPCVTASTIPVPDKVTASSNDAIT